MKNFTRIAITGGPSSGKTSIIRHLKKKGHATIPEVARIILKNIESPKSKEEIERAQLVMYSIQQELEDSCSTRTFLDRSLVDYASYTKHILGYSPEYMKKLRGRYDMVFALERLPLIRDGLRLESTEEEAQEMHDLVLDEYLAQGYFPVSVPTFPSKSLEESIEMRANYILDRAGQLQSTLF